MKKEHALFLALTLLGQNAKASVLINELMPRNVSYLIDEEFNYSGWVELYNNGAESFDLSQCVFSDGKHTWESETTDILEPGGYTLFYFDELNSYNHASFKLDVDGGSLTLTTKNGLELDNVVYTKALRNVSFGRLSDGGNELGTLSKPTPGKANSNLSKIEDQAEAPAFSLAPGFYKGKQLVSISSVNANAKIYYTLDGSEPTPETATLYTGPIEVAATTPIRAIATEEGKHFSDIKTGTYFINNREISLPVISIVTDNKFFYDDEIGMLVVGVNGGEVPSYCSFPEDQANFMTDWERPCNIEYFSRDGKQEQLNMEVKASNFGACSRTKYTKSLKIKANKAYGGKKMDCALFREKPNLQWKSVVLRNSGNDFGRSYLRDGFMQSLLIGQVDIDHQAYEPAIVYINGNYYGLLNIRERTNKDFIFSNYGLEEEDIYIEEVSSSLKVSTEGYKEVAALLEEPDMNAEGMYEKIDQQIDINEFLNYFMAQIYYANTDWAGGNLKAWKRIENGKWRWILYDTDFGFSCYGSNFNTNTFTNAEKNVTFKGFIKNQKIRDRFISKFAVHLGTTFEPGRVKHILDSLSSYIKEEALIYQDYLSEVKKLEQDWKKDINNMNTFAEKRPDNLYKQIATYFSLGDTAGIRVYADMPETRFLFNDELVNTSDLNTKFYLGEDIRIKALAPDGYKFDHWDIIKDQKLISPSAVWKYYSKGNLPSEDWMIPAHSDASWKSAEAPLGYNVSSLVKTTINGKDDAGANLMAVYFRRNFTIDDDYSGSALEATINYNNGAVVYLNGKEIYRTGMPTGPVTYETKATAFVSKYKTDKFTIAPGLLQKGENVIAVEVHGNSATNTSLAFGFELVDPMAKPKVVTSTDITYEDNFSCKSSYKAVFAADPEWDANVTKLFLNEICATNKQYVDEHFQDEDWIEIYNDGTSPINIGGMYISDERKDPTKYQIADSVPELTTIPAKGYLVLWADGEPEQGILHTNFELPITRTQTISLSKMVDGELFLIDSVRYEPHAKGETFARFSYDFDGQWAITSLPTFKAENKLAFRLDIEEAVSDGINIAVYPNPTADILWFSLPWENATANVQISDGIRTITETNIEDKGGIEVAHLPAGLYFAVVRNNNTKEMQVIKFIKY
ncbi:MAG: CotH kinase family protein [Paludibacteraceae bacterium]|nr:CotH kinase family protein [Paludibacteraceae bacterium]